MAFDVKGALDAGYSLSEINDFLGQQSKFDVNSARQAGYNDDEILGFLSSRKLEVAPEAAPAALDPQPITATPDELSRANPDTPAPQGKGLISQIVDALRPGTGSVMDGYKVSSDQVQANRDQLLSYGVGPIRSETAAKADLVRSGVVQTDEPGILKIAQQMAERDEPGLVDLVSRAKQNDVQAQEDAADRARRERFAEENLLLGSLASGSAGMMSGMANIPSVAADAFNQTFVNPVLEAVGLKPIGRVPTAFGTEYLAKAADAYMPAVGKQEMGDAWDKNEFAPWLMSKLAANSPQIAQSLLAAFVPPLRAVLLPSLSGTAAGQSYAQGDDSRVAVAKGAVEYASEKLPLGVFDKIGDVLKGVSIPKQNAILAVAGQRLLQSGSAVTALTLTNAIEETAAQLGGNALDKYFQGKDVDLTKGLAEAAVIGGATGKLMSVPQATAALTGYYEPGNQIARAIEQNVADAQFVIPAEALARRALSPQTYNPRLIDPVQTVDPAKMQQTISQAQSVDEAIAVADQLTGSVAQMTGPIEANLAAAAQMPPATPVIETSEQVLASADNQPAQGLVRMYHGGNPEGVDGPLWFTADLEDAKGWAGRSPGMGLWYVDVPERTLVEGFGVNTIQEAKQQGFAPLSRIELPAEIANQRQPLNLNSSQTTAPTADPIIEQQFGLDQLRLDNGLPVGITPTNTPNTPRPQRIQGKDVSSFTDDQLDQISQDETVPAITRRGALVELTARRNEAGATMVQPSEVARVEPTLNTEQPAVSDALADADPAGRIEPVLDVNTLTFPPMRDTPVAPVGGELAAGRARRDAQKSVKAWAERQGVETPAIFNPAPVELDSAVNQIAQLVNTQLGGRIYAYSDGREGAVNGVSIRGVAFVNTANLEVSAGRTALHEFKHTVEQIARAEASQGLTNTPAQRFTAQIDSIYDDMTDAGKQAYIEKFLHKDELAAIADPAARQARVQELMQSPQTRSEMTADFLGNRATDRQFWLDIAQADPQGFRGFVQKWLRTIDNLINALRGKPNQNSDESARVDRYVRDLNKAKMVAREALIAYSRAAQGQTQADAEQTPAFSPRTRGGKAEQVGDFTVRTQKDGTLGVTGDVNEIRALLPDGVKGRPIPGGIVFTTSDAPRVRAALEGRKLAYSRAGQVLDKLPMKNGKYIGAPEKYNTPAKISTLRKNLRKLTLEGERGRYWYENSSRAILMMAGGNVQEARKFVALLAIYSPQAKVDANSTFALRAWAQYKAGQKISVKTEVMDNKAQAALDDVDAFWSGEKTGNFFFNLLREIDPTTAGKQGATIDMWMMRAGEYNTDAPTATQYAFMENETNRIAQELSWEPQQVQAAIWVAMKARMENAGVKRRTEQTSEKKGWIRFDYPLKKGKPVKTRVILNAKAHRDNWLKHAFAHTPTQADTEQAKFDFSDGVRRHIGQISWEARPGRSTNVLPGVNDASYEQQTEFQQAVQKALLDDNGVDLLAYKLGLLVDGPDILAPGVWQGEIAAGMQKRVAMAPAKGDDGKSGIDPAQRDALGTYAAVLGLVLRQEGVGYHRPFYSAKKSGENGVNLDIGRTFTPDEAQSLWGAIDARMQERGLTEWEKKAGLVSSPTGMRVVNFGAIKDNKVFRELVKDAAATLTVEDIKLIGFTSDGDLIENNWKENPNGEDYRSRISSAGSPDLLGWTRDVLAPRIQAVFDEFSSRYGWGNPGQVDSLFRPEDNQQASAEEVDSPSFSQRQPEFYSRLARVIDGVPDRLATQPAKQWQAWLASNAPKLGVKKDEIEWSGINDYLDLRGKDKVTKGEISDYLANNGVQVKDVTLFDPDTDFSLDDWLLNWAENNTGKTADLIQRGASWDDTLAQAKREGKDEVVNRIEAKSSPARYQRYTISGGENYREVLLTLPSKNSVAGISPVQAARILFNKEYGQLTEDQQQEVKRRINDDETPQTYMSSHWDKPNVLAHLRLNDRSDVDGNRVLFVEELQSDWGQEGKKKGFGKVTRFEYEAVQENGQLVRSFRDKDEAQSFARERGLQLNEIPFTVDTGIPVAPFVTKTEGWLNLALKRVAMLAVEGGYDKVAFVNGEQSADRYDLSKQIDSIKFNKMPDGNIFWTAYREGSRVTGADSKPSELADQVGKELAEKMLAQDGPGELSGIDLKVGGEGMKTFYDQIVPQAVNKLLPKIGGQRLGTVDIALPSNVSERNRGAFVVEQDLETPFDGEVTLRRRMPNGDTVTIGVMTRAEAEDYTDNPENYTGQTVQQPGFDVTDQMRETVSQGLPMFSRRQKDSWLLGRDEVGRINFGAGAKAYDAVAALANRVLDYVKLKPISPELSRAIKRMKNEIEKVQDLTARTAELLKDIPESERQMISDVIEGELKAGVTPPQRVLNLAASMQGIMSQQSTELVRLGMLSSAAAARWDNKYLPRFYESKLGDEAKAWARAAKSLFGRQATMQGIKGDSLKARGMFETIDVADLAQWQSQGWEQRDPDFDPAADTQTVVWRDFSRTERERMGEIRDAMFRFTMGYMRTQRDIALGRLYESLSQNYASARPMPGYVQVPNTKVEGTMASRYGKLSNMWVPPEVLDQLSNVDRSLENGVLKIYRSALSKWKEGKALALDTPIPTPAGWTTMGDIQVGDVIFDENGKPCTVTFATPVQLDRKCFEVEFSDGEKIVADAEHLWFTVRQGKPGVRTTEQIAGTLKYAAGKYNAHSVPVAGSLVIPDAQLPVDPYYLGVWLGNGTSRGTEITSCEADSIEIMSMLKSRGFGIGAVRKDPRGDIVTYQVGFNDHRPRKLLLQPALRAIGVLGDKHIPTVYLRASERQRMDLLRGLMDTDGTIDKNGKVSFCTASKKLLDGFIELARSLGFKPAFSEVSKKYQNGISRAWVVRMHAPSDRPVFLLQRKRARLAAPVTRRARSQSRQIVSITPVQSVPVRCIQVSSESRLYLAGRGMIPTHNTVLNPVSHANNVISNVTQAHFAGVSYWDVQKYAGAIKDLVANSAMVEEAKDVGLFGGTFVQSEIVQSMPPQLRQLAGMSESKLSKMTEGIWDTLAFTVQYNGKKYGARPVMQWAYEHEDLFFRYLIYRDARKRGLAPEDAREFSEQYIFTYDDLPRGARVIRDAAIPFFTYSYKITPVLARTLLEYPWRFAAPAAVAYAANAAMYAAATAIAGGDDDEWWGKLLYRYATDAEFRQRARDLEKEERKNLPPWMKGASILGTPKAIRMGMDDVTGLPMFLDISRVVPGGDIVEAENNAGGLGIPNMFAPNNPILTTLMALQGNRDLFTGKDVVNKDTDTSAEQAEKRAAWAWKQFSPAIAVGNYHFNRAMNVVANVTGQPITLQLGENRAISWTGTGRDGLPTQPELAALQTVGIKLRPIDLDTSAQIAESNRKRILRDLATDMKRLQRLENKGAISPEAADVEREQIIIKRDRVRERLTVDGDEPK